MVIRTDRNRIESYQRGKPKEPRTLVIWRGMVRRTTNPKDKRWADYGGRGITIVKRWLKYENFLADMGEAPEGRSIDRIDNDKGYSKANCRWATAAEQQANMRSNRKITINGETFHVSEWARRLGVHNSTICKRITVYGMTPEAALTTPFPLKESALATPIEFHCFRCNSNFKSNRPKIAYAPCCGSQHWNKPWMRGTCQDCSYEWTVKSKLGVARKCSWCNSKAVESNRQFAEVI